MKKIFLVLTLFLSAIFISQNFLIRAIGQESNESDINTLLSETPIYFSKDSKTYKLTNVNEEAEEIAPVDGVLSRDKTKLAYTLNDKDYKTSPYFYIYNILDKTTETISADLGYLFSINSWSLDNENIVIIKHAQYVGGMRAHIFSMESKSFIKEFNITNSDGYWKDDKYIFSDPMNECSEDSKVIKICDPQGSSVSVFDLKTNEIKSLKKLADQLNLIPNIEKNISEDLNEIVYTEFYPELQDFAREDEEKIYTEINSEGDQSNRYVGENAFNIKKLEDKIDKEYESVLIREFKKNAKDPNWYIVILESTNSNHSLLLVNISNEEPVLEITSETQLATW